MLSLQILVLALILISPFSRKKTFLLIKENLFTQILPLPLQIFIFDSAIKDVSNFICYLKLEGIFIYKLSKYGVKLEVGKLRLDFNESIRQQHGEFFVGLNSLNS